MSTWRFGRGWPRERLQELLGALAALPVSFDSPLDQMTPENGWLADGTEGGVFLERPGPPEPSGIFAHAKEALVEYGFSDPRIVEGHFDRRSPFVGRNILLEIKVLGFHFLNGVRVHSVREQSDGRETVFGFRYDTLMGHIERGFEWFLLTKDHATGQVRFRIEARWRPGDFPNLWMRVGFFLLSAFYRHLWRKRALGRLRALARLKTAEKI